MTSSRLLSLRASAEQNMGVNDATLLAFPYANENDRTMPATPLDPLRYETVQGRLPLRRAEVERDRLGRGDDAAEIPAATVTTQPPTCALVPRQESSARSRERPERHESGAVAVGREVGPDDFAVVSHPEMPVAGAAPPCAAQGDVQRPPAGPTRS